MLDRSIEVETADGAMATFLTQPDARQSWPLVLLLMDAPGIRDELFAMARQLGQAGYAVAVPNLYYRTTTQGAGTDRHAMYRHMNALAAPSVCADLETLVAACDTAPGIATQALGCVGYCMSGPFAVAAAAHFGQRMTAAASIHGVRLCHQGKHSAHRLLPAVTAELYFGCAQHDAWAPPAIVGALEHALALVGARSRVEWYPGARHGFVFSQRPAFQRTGAERHWQRLQALFARNLPRPSETA